MDKRYLAMQLWLCERQVKRENSTLLVAVRVSKTRVLKLPNVTFVPRSSIGLGPLTLTRLHRGSSVTSISTALQKIQRVIAEQGSLEGKNSEKETISCVGF